MIVHTQMCVAFMCLHACAQAQLASFKHALLPGH